MAPSIDYPLQLVSQKILEDWAMMLTDEVQEAEAGFNPDEKLYMAWIDVDGCVRGALSIVAQANFMISLASNLLGLDSDAAPSEADCADALREMGNVLAGNFFTEAFGEDVVFDLINPTVSEIPHSELKRIAGRKTKHYFRADESPVVVTFSVKET